MPARDVREARERCRRKFLRVFRQGFSDARYLDQERDHKWAAHERWKADLNEEAYQELLAHKRFDVIVQQAMAVEALSNLLFPFERMALRDAVRPPEGARTFALALYTWLYGNPGPETRFTKWVDTVEHLPRRQTRVLTWPLVSVFGLIALPRQHLFLKPQVTKAAARAYRSEFHYRARPEWITYQSLLDFGDLLQSDLADLRPRDMIDIQSFIRVLGSPEYG